MSAAPVLAVHEAFRGGDMEALLRHVHPEVEISDPERTGAGPFRGHDEFLKFLRDWMETWDEYEVGLEAPVVVGETVVAGAHLYRVRDGQIVFWRPYTDRSEALAAAGLRDPDGWRAAIDMLRDGYAAWNRRDYNAFLALLPPGFEFVPVLESPDMPAFSGEEGIERFWESLLSTWESFVFTPLSYAPTGDRILVEVRVNAKARASGIELEEHWAHVYTLRDGEFVRLQAFLGRDEALGALLS